VTLVAPNWPAVESLSTAVAAGVAAVTVLVTLFVYSRQNRLARAAAIRSVMGIVLRDSGQIHDLTFDSSDELADSGVREFRRKLGSSADADMFRRNFFQPGEEGHFVVGSAFMAGYLASPAYSRLSKLWDEIDKASADLRGKLRVFNYSAKLMVDTSMDACYPRLCSTLAEEMRGYPELAAGYQYIGNLDELVLAVATRLGRTLRQELGTGWPYRLYEMKKFVEDLYAVIGEMTDRSMLKLTSDRKFDWHCLSMVPATSAAATAGAATGQDSAEKAAETDARKKARWDRADDRRLRDEEHIKQIETLLADLEPYVRAEDFAKLNTRIKNYKETYDPYYKRVPPA
jgi:hypothetical protein